MTQTAWKDLLRVNRWVNETIKPMTENSPISSVRFASSTSIPSL